MPFLLTGAQREKMCYTLPMEIANMKVRRQTLKRLKLLAAMQEDTMMNVLDRLVEAELARMQAGQKEPPHARDPRLQDCT